MPENNGTGRLDRIEKALELLIHDHVQFREEHKQLLTAQVLLTDRVDKIARAVEELAAGQRELAAAHKELAAAQKELAAAQKVTELRVSELAETFRAFLTYLDRPKQQ